MWNRILGKSNDLEKASSTSGRRRETESHRSAPRRSESLKSPTSSGNPVINEERDRGFHPTSTSYSSTTRNQYPDTASASIGTSFATASNDPTNDQYPPPGLVRNASLANQIPKSAAGEEEHTAALGSSSRSRREKQESSSMDQKRERKERRGTRDRDDETRGSKSSRDSKSRRDSKKGKERAMSTGEIAYISNERQDRALPASDGRTGSSSLVPLAGRYDVSRPESLPGQQSSHVQHQFPGQFPTDSAAPYRPPVAASEGGPGLAAEYYGDAGQSVADQPGVRIHSPSLIVGAEPHLQPASAVAAPPQEPSALGGVGAAASFFDGTFSAGSDMEDHHGPKPTPTNGSSIIPHGSIAPSASFHATSSSAPTDYHSSSAPVIPTLGAAAAGAAAGYYMSSRPPKQERPERPEHASSSINAYGSIPGSSGYQHTDVSPRPSKPAPPEHGSTSTSGYGRLAGPSTHQHPTASHDQHISYSSSGRPPAKAGKHSSQSSNIPLYAAGAAGLAAATHHHSYHHDHSITAHQNSHGQHYSGGSMAQQHRHRHRGPLSTLVDFFKDPDGVAQFEEYTEFIGVCRHCFAPGSSPRDAPRKHNYRRRRRSNERLGSSVRVDKESRYWSSENENRRRRNKSWLGAGIAGYGLGKMGENLFKQDRDFDDSHSVYSGKVKRSHRRGSSSSPDRKSRTSRGRAHRSSDILPYETRSEGRIETGVTSDGKLYRKDPHGDIHTTAVKTDISRHTSRSRSRDRTGRLSEAALGAAIGSSVIASTSRRRSRSPKKAFVRSKHDNDSRSELTSVLKLNDSESHDGHHRSRHSPNSSHRKGRRKEKRSRGFFTFSNGSSSSSGSSNLAFGAGHERRSTKNTRSKTKDKSSKDADAAILGLGAAAAALALSQNQRSKHKGELIAVKELKSKDRPAQHERKGKKPSSSSEDLWESASEGEWSSADSELAYGASMHRRSFESLSSDSSGLDKWSWRWGSKKQPKKPKNDRRRSSGFDHVSQAATPPATGFNGSQLPAEGHWQDSRTTSNSNAPLQHVYPMPTSDPTRFDVARHDTGFPSHPPYTNGRPDPVPIQHPQPVASVSPAVYTTQSPYPHSYSAPTGPPSLPQHQYPATVISRNSPIQRDNQAPGAFPTGNEYFESLVKDSKKDSEPRRRDSSPVTRMSEITPISSGARRKSLRDDASSVRFDLTKEQEDKDRREERRRRKEEDKRLERLEREEMESRKAAEQDRLSRRDAASKSQSERGSTEEPVHVRKESWAAPAAAGVIAAAIGATVAAKGSIEDERREGYDERHKGREERDIEVIVKERYRPTEDSASEDNQTRGRPSEKVGMSVWQAAAKIKRTPSHTGYAAYFTPRELLEKDSDVKQIVGPNADNDITVYQVPRIVTVEPAAPPRHSASRAYSIPIEAKDREDGKKPLPWSVPQLNLVEPTPPSSRSGSVAGSRSPQSRSPLSKEIVADIPLEPLESLTDSPVAFAGPEHVEYTVIEPKGRSPPAVDSPVDDFNVSEAVPGISSLKNRKKPKESPPRADYGDDLDFAATVAAGLQDTGFDPSIVIDDLSFRRRESPPGSETEDFSRGPTATVIEITDPNADPKSPPHGFVEEIPEHRIPGTFDDDEERTIRSLLEPTEEGRSTEEATGPSDNVGAKPQVYSVEPVSTEPAAMSNAAVDPVGDVSYNRRKAAESERKTGELTEPSDNARAEPQVYTAEPDSFEPESVGELPTDPVQGNQRSVASDNEFSRAQPLAEETAYSSPDKVDYPSDDAPSVAATAPVVSSSSQSSKSKKKSKRRSVGFDDTTSIISAPATFEDTKETKAKPEKGRKGGIFGMFSRSVENLPESNGSRETPVEAELEDFEEPKKRSKKSKSRKATLDDDEAVPGATGPTASQEPEDRDDWSTSKKSKRGKEKRRSSEQDSGRITQDLPAQVIPPAFHPHDPLSSSSQMLTNFEADHDLSEQGADVGIEAMNNRSQAYDDKEPSFLGERPGKPPLPDLPDASEDPGGQRDLERDLAFTQGVQSTLSSKESPASKSDKQKWRLSDLHSEDRIVSHPSPSPTAVPLRPLRFGRLPSSPGLAKSLPSTPQPPTSADLPFTPRRRERPHSTEFKSNEFRPIWLLEKHGSRQEPAPQETYPSLPSSHTTSRASSIHEADDQYQMGAMNSAAGEPINQFVPAHRGLAIDTSHSVPDSGLLDSQQATPTAASFHSMLQEGDSHAEQTLPQAGQPQVDSADLVSTPEAFFDPLEETARDERLLHDFDDLFPQRRSTSPSRYDVGLTEEIPRQPEVQTSTHPEASIKEGGGTASMLKDVALGAIIGGSAAALLKSTSQHDENLEQASDKADINEILMDEEDNAPKPVGNIPGRPTADEMRLLQEQDAQDAVDSWTTSPQLRKAKSKKGRKRGENLEVMESVSVEGPAAELSKSLTDDAPSTAESMKAASILLPETPLGEPNVEAASMDWQRPLLNRKDSKGKKKKSKKKSTDTWDDKSALPHEPAADQMPALKPGPEESLQSTEPASSGEPSTGAVAVEGAEALPTNADVSRDVASLPPSAAQIEERVEEPITSSSSKKNKGGKKKNRQLSLAELTPDGNPIMLADAPPTEETTSKDFDIPLGQPVLSTVSSAEEAGLSERTSEEVPYEFPSSDKPRSEVEDVPLLPTDQPATHGFTVEADQSLVPFEQSALDPAIEKQDAQQLPIQSPSAAAPVTEEVIGSEVFDRGILPSGEAIPPVPESQILPSCIALPEDDDFDLVQSPMAEELIGSEVFDRGILPSQETVPPGAQSRISPGSIALPDDDDLDLVEPPDSPVLQPIDIIQASQDIQAVPDQTPGVSDKTDEPSGKQPPPALEGPRESAESNTLAAEPVVLTKAISELNLPENATLAQPGDASDRHPEMKAEVPQQQSEEEWPTFAAKKSKKGKKGKKDKAAKVDTEQDVVGIEASDGKGMESQVSDDLTLGQALSEERAMPETSPSNPETAGRREDETLSQKHFIDEAITEPLAEDEEWPTMSKKKMKGKKSKKVQFNEPQETQPEEIEAPAAREFPSAITSTADDVRGMLHTSEPERVAQEVEEIPAIQPTLGELAEEPLALPRDQSAGMEEQAKTEKGQSPLLGPFKSPSAHEEKPPEVVADQPSETAEQVQTIDPSRSSDEPIMASTGTATEVQDMLAEERSTETPSMLAEPTVDELSRTKETDDFAWASSKKKKKGKNPKVFDSAEADLDTREVSQPETPMRTEPSAPTEIAASDTLEDFPAKKPKRDEKSKESQPVDEAAIADIEASEGSQLTTDLRIEAPIAEGISAIEPLDGPSSKKSKRDKKSKRKGLLRTSSDVQEEEETQPTPDVEDTYTGEMVITDDAPSILERSDPLPSIEMPATPEAAVTEVSSDNVAEADIDVENKQLDRTHEQSVPSPSPKAAAIPAEVPFDAPEMEISTKAPSVLEKHDKLPNVDLPMSPDPVFNVGSAIDSDHALPMATAAEIPTSSPPLHAEVPASILEPEAGSFLKDEAPLPSGLKDEWVFEVNTVVREVNEPVPTPASADVSMKSVTQSINQPLEDIADRPSSPRAVPDESALQPPTSKRDKKKSKKARAALAWEEEPSAEASQQKPQVGNEILDLTEEAALEVTVEETPTKNKKDKKKSKKAKAVASEDDVPDMSAEVDESVREIEEPAINQPIESSIGDSSVVVEDIPTSKKDKKKGNEAKAMAWEDDAPEALGEVPEAERDVSANMINEPVVEETPIVEEEPVVSKKYKQKGKKSKALSWGDDAAEASTAIPEIELDIESISAKPPIFATEETPIIEEEPVRSKRDKKKAKKSKALSWEEDELAVPSRSEQQQQEAAYAEAEAVGEPLSKVAEPTPVDEEPVPKKSKKKSKKSKFTDWDEEPSTPPTAESTEPDAVSVQQEANAEQPKDIEVATEEGTADIAFDEAPSKKGKKKGRKSKSMDWDEETTVPSIPPETDEPISASVEQDLVTGPQKAIEEIPAEEPVEVPEELSSFKKSKKKGKKSKVVAWDNEFPIPPSRDETEQTHINADMPEVQDLTDVQPPGGAGQLEDDRFLASTPKSKKDKKKAKKSKAPAWEEEPPAPSVQDLNPLNTTGDLADQPSLQAGVSEAKGEGQGTTDETFLEQGPEIQPEVTAILGGEPQAVDLTTRVEAEPFSDAPSIPAEELRADEDYKAAVVPNLSWEPTSVHESSSDIPTLPERSSSVEREPESAPTTGDALKIAEEVIPPPAEENVAHSLPLPEDAANEPSERVRILATTDTSHVAEDQVAPSIHDALTTAEEVITLASQEIVVDPSSLTKVTIFEKPEPVPAPTTPDAADSAEDKLAPRIEDALKTAEEVIPPLSEEQIANVSSEHKNTTEDPTPGPTPTTTDALQSLKEEFAPSPVGLITQEPDLPAEVPKKPASPTPVPEAESVNTVEEFPSISKKDEKKSEKTKKGIARDNETVITTQDLDVAASEPIVSAGLEPDTGFSDPAIVEEPFAPAEPTESTSLAVSEPTAEILTEAVQAPPSLKSAEAADEFPAVSKKDKKKSKRNKKSSTFDEEDPSLDTIPMEAVPESSAAEITEPVDEIFSLSKRDKKSKKSKKLPTFDDDELSLTTTPAEPDPVADTLDEIVERPPTPEPSASEIVVPVDDSFLLSKKDKKKSKKSKKAIGFDDEPSESATPAEADLVPAVPDEAIEEVHVSEPGAAGTTEHTDDPFPPGKKEKKSKKSKKALGFDDEGSESTAPPQPDLLAAVTERAAFEDLSTTSGSVLAEAADEFAPINKKSKKGKKSKKSIGFDDEPSGTTTPADLNPILEVIDELAEQPIIAELGTPADEFAPIKKKDKKGNKGNRMIEVEDEPSRTTAPRELDRKIEVVDETAQEPTPLAQPSSPAEEFAIFGNKKEKKAKKSKKSTASDNDFSGTTTPRELDPILEVVDKAAERPSVIAESSTFADEFSIGKKEKKGKKLKKGPTFDDEPSEATTPAELDPETDIAGAVPDELSASVNEFPSVDKKGKKKGKKSKAPLTSDELPSKSMTPADTEPSLEPSIREAEESSLPIESSVPEIDEFSSTSKKDRKKAKKGKKALALDDEEPSGSSKPLTPDADMEVMDLAEGPPLTAEPSVPVEEFPAVSKKDKKKGKKAKKVLTWEDQDPEVAPTPEGAEAVPDQSQEQAISPPPVLEIEPDHDQCVESYIPEDASAPPTSTEAALEDSLAPEIVPGAEPELPASGKKGKKDKKKAKRTLAIDWDDEVATESPLPGVDPAPITSVAENLDLGPSLGSTTRGVAEIIEPADSANVHPQDEEPTHISLSEPPLTSHSEVEMAPRHEPPAAVQSAIQPVESIEPQSPSMVSGCHHQAEPLQTPMTPPPEYLSRLPADVSVVQTAQEPTDQSTSTMERVEAEELAPSTAQELSIVEEDDFSSVATTKKSKKGKKAKKQPIIWEDDTATPPAADQEIDAKVHSASVPASSRPEMVAWPTEVRINQTEGFAQYHEEPSVSGDAVPGPVPPEMDAPADIPVGPPAIVEERSDYFDSAPRRDMSARSRSSGHEAHNEAAAPATAPQRKLVEEQNGQQANTAEPSRSQEVAVEPTDDFEGIATKKKKKKSKRQQVVDDVMWEFPSMNPPLPPTPEAEQVIPAINDPISDAQLDREIDAELDREMRAPTGEQPSFAARENVTKRELPQQVGPGEILAPSDDQGKMPVSISEQPVVGETVDDEWGSVPKKSKKGKKSKKNKEVEVDEVDTLPTTSLKDAEATLLAGNSSPPDRGPGLDAARQDTTEVEDQPGADEMPASYRTESGKIMATAASVGAGIVAAEQLGRKESKKGKKNRKSRQASSTWAEAEEESMPVVDPQNLDENREDQGRALTPERRRSSPIQAWHQYISPSQSPKQSELYDVEDDRPRSAGSSRRKRSYDKERNKVPTPDRRSPIQAWHQYNSPRHSPQQSETHDYEGRQAKDEGSCATAEYVNRDSAVHVSDSPLVPEQSPVRRVMRDSGYPDTEASTNVGAGSEHQEHLHHVSPHASTYEEFKMPRHTIPQARSSEELREPSPVSSTTKDRSSVLFQSSPSTREEHAQQQQRERGHHQESNDQYEADYNEDDHHDRDAAPRSMDPPREDNSARVNAQAETLAALSGLRNPDQDPTLPSIFGGPLGIRSDAISPETPSDHDGANRRRLNTITEYSPEESPLHNRNRKLSDVGSPVHGVKTARRSATPQAISKRRARSSSTEQDKGMISADDLTAVDEEKQHLDIERSRSRGTDQRPSSHQSNISSLVSSLPKQREYERRSLSGASNHSVESINAIIRTPPDQTRSASGMSNRSSGTPPLRRTDRSVSGDLRGANRKSEALKRAKQPEAETEIAATLPSITPDPSNERRKSRVKDMASVFEGYGDFHGSPISPTRPPSMRRRQSMQVLELESKLDQLASENRLLHDTRQRVEREMEDAARNRGEEMESYREGIETRDTWLRQKDTEISELKETLESLQSQVLHLSEVNEGLHASSRELDDHQERYGQLEAEHAQTYQRWQESTRELEALKDQHAQLSAGMEDIVRHEVSIAVSEKDHELHRLQSELDTAKQQIRALQAQILASKNNASADSIIPERDEDYFDAQCQSLCSHVQQWVLRFSKFSDNRACYLASEISDEKIVDRMENAILDGSDPDDYLADRIKRRDVFMSMVMTMTWEFIFTRYLFGADREQRQKLKSLEKQLGESTNVPMSAVHRWRATTLALLSKREAFVNQRTQDTEAVMHTIYDTLATILPPPSHLVPQIQQSLRKVLATAVDLSIEMRTQKAEYVMLPPLQPEYDTNGDLARKVYFNAALMNERSGSAGSSNEELEAGRAVVRMVLFPLVVKKGDGEEGEEIVVCPAQVLVRPEGKGKGVRVVSAQGGSRSVERPAVAVAGEGEGDVAMGNMF
ncbi:MAG: hypothetical protein Q9208_000650 [Pyrenodesmia sp. 3 TL-2023]